MSADARQATSELLIGRRLGGYTITRCVGKGGMGTLFVNDKEVASGRIDKTQCCAFSADEGADVGMDEGTPVDEAYKVPFKFNGKIAKVTIDLKDMKKADSDDAERSRKAAALKKGLSD